MGLSTTWMSSLIPRGGRSSFSLSTRATSTRTTTATRYSPSAFAWNPSSSFVNHSRRCRYNPNHCFGQRTTAGSGSVTTVSWPTRKQRLTTSATTATVPKSSVIIIKSSSKDNPTSEWKLASHSSSEFVTHVVVDEDDDGTTLTVQDAIASVLAEKYHYYSSDNNTVVEDGQEQNSNDDQQQQQPIIYEWNPQFHPYKALELLQLGSVWFLPATAPRDPSLGAKPTRLSETDATNVMQPNDYLRIHHDPRRFPAVYDYDWTTAMIPRRRRSEGTETDNNNNNKPGVIVAQNEAKGWVVIHKPPNVPVHMTVDNRLENAATMLVRGLLLRKQQQQEQTQTESEEENGHTGVTSRISSLSSSSSTTDDSYVVAPQRLDQNTSGLIVYATNKEFANYFAALLRNKTSAHLLLQQQQQDVDPSTTAVGTDSNVRDGRSNRRGCASGAVRKLYRCLVCVVENKSSQLQQQLKDSQTSSWSVQGAVDFLESFCREDRVMRHYLEPSVRAPKVFVTERPSSSSSFSNEDNNDKSVSAGAVEWPECLLKIKKVSKVFALVGNDPGQRLAAQLWEISQSGSSGDQQKEKTTTKVPMVATVMPPNCKAVVELEIELLTGRTHQIRGQLSACGFPLVQDAQYGGAIPIVEDPPSLLSFTTETAYAANSIRGDLYFPYPSQLALQCCRLEFLDPDVSKIMKKGSCVLKLTPSDRWNRFELEEAWWTPLLEDYTKNSEDLSAQEATMSPSAPSSTTATPKPVFSSLAADVGLTESSSMPQYSSIPTTSSSESSTLSSSKSSFESSSSGGRAVRPELLPPSVSLSAGRNKYVIIRATIPKIDEENLGQQQQEIDDNREGGIENDDTDLWFVKSAAPHECGGPYHGNVAQDLREWIQAAGYDVYVTGGGRIDYCPPSSSQDGQKAIGSAIVYGFSYGFGKGDHARAAAIIQTFFGDSIVATFDNSDGIY